MLPPSPCSLPSLKPSLTPSGLYKEFAKLSKAAAEPFKAMKLDHLTTSLGVHNSPFSSVVSTKGGIDTRLEGSADLQGGLRMPMTSP